MAGPSLDACVRFFDYGEGDRKLLAELGPILERHADELVEAFYHHLLSFPETRRHLRDRKVAGHLKSEQRRYLLSLAGPELDEAYLADRRRIGDTHERIGIEPVWYMGSYSLYLSMLIPVVCSESAGDTERAARTVSALAKLLLFDAHVAMEQYQRRRSAELEFLNEELAQSGRRLARDLERSDSALRRAAERATAAERLASIGTLVAGLAHEIGTPMGVIQGHAKLLESAVADEGGLWRLRTIQEQIGRISRIMKSLLGMARPSRSRRVAVDLGVLLDGTLAFLTEKVSRRRVDVLRELRPCDSVAGDPERLQQLFLNLFLNAIDAMPDGGTLRVGVRPGPHAGEVEVSVADTGAGIPPEQVERIFDPFFTTKAAGEGNGLGLAVAHGIVAEHHGTIEVARSDASGTEFRIHLPRWGD